MLMLLGKMYPLCFVLVLLQHYILFLLLAWCKLCCYISAFHQNCQFKCFIPVIFFSRNVEFVRHEMELRSVLLFKADEPCCLSIEKVKAHHCSTCCSFPELQVVNPNDQQREHDVC